MANTGIMHTFTYILVVLVSLLAIAAGNPVDADTGMIICEPSLSPYLCQLRLTMYNTEVYEVDNNWFNVLMHVYDPWCRQISGNVWANMGEHVSVTSELPWTIEVQLPDTCWAFNALGYIPAYYARYGGDHAFPSSNFAIWRPEFGKLWGGMTSALFGFHC